MVESFLKYLQYEKRYSPKTLVAYANDLRQFTAYLQYAFSQTDPLQAEYNMVRSWVVHLTEEGVSASSVNRKLASLRSFYKFCGKQGTLIQNPTTHIHALKTKKRVPHFIREAEVIEMLDNNSFPDDLQGWRARLILELFYSSGIRLAELINLKEANVNFRENVIKVLGKRNKERVVPIPESVVHIIRQYLAVRNRDVAMKDHGCLLVTDTGEQLYPMFVYRLVKEHLKQWTTTEKTSPHVLRHTYATHLLNKGAEINAVKDLLGHTSLAATQVYTHNTIEKLKKVFEKAHPKA